MHVWVLFLCYITVPICLLALGITRKSNKQVGHNSKGDTSMKILRANGEVAESKFEEREGKEAFWHSSAHILAQAVTLMIFRQIRETLTERSGQGQRRA